MAVVASTCGGVGVTPGVDDPVEGSGKQLTFYMAPPRPRRVVLDCKEELHHPPYRIQYPPHDPQAPTHPPPNTGNRIATATPPPSGGFAFITIYHTQYVLHARQPPPRSAAAPHRVHGSATVGVSSAPAVHDRHSTATTPLRKSGPAQPAPAFSSGYRTALRRSRFSKSPQHPYSRTAAACGRYRCGCVGTTCTGPVAASVVPCCLYVDCDGSHGWCGVVVVILPPLPVYAVLRRIQHPQRPAVYTVAYRRTHTPVPLSLFSTRSYSSVDTSPVGGVCFAPYV